MPIVSPKRSLSVLVALGLVASLAACATDTPQAQPSTTREPSPSASQEAPQGSRPPITDLVLTTEGLGELQFGAAPPAGNPATDFVTYDGDACAGTGAADPGLWVTNYPDIDDGFGPVPPFGVQVIDGTVDRIDVNTSHIITDEGLSVGSSLDAVLGTYPGGPDEVIAVSDISEVYVFLGTKGKLLFEVAVDDATGYWEPSVVGTVVYLSAVAMDVAPFAKAGSDNVIGVCNNS